MLDTAGIKGMNKEIGGVLFHCFVLLFCVVVVLGCLGFFTQSGGFLPIIETTPFL